MAQITVYGWIRSGNRWLCRLLTYYGDQPVDYKKNLWFAHVDTWYFGTPVRIQIGGHASSPQNNSHEHAVHIFRDPRDAFVSWYYFLTNVPNQHWPAKKDRTWQDFLPWLVEQERHPFRKYMEQWLEAKERRQPGILWTTHEDLVADRAGELLRLVGEMGFPQNRERAERAAMLSEAEPIREKGSHGGVPEAWREWYDAEDAQFIDQHYGDLIERLGYGKEIEWLDLVGKA